MLKMSILKREYSHKKIRRRRNIYIYIGKDENGISSDE